MPNELHLLRSSAARAGSTRIGLNEWRTALQATEGVRLAAEPYTTLRNPRTGQVVEIPNDPGDAEVYFPDFKAWRVVFRWRDGVVRFNAAAIEDEVVSRIVKELALHLNATVHGESGGSVDLG